MDGVSSSLVLWKVLSKIRIGSCLDVGWHSVVAVGLPSCFRLVSVQGASLPQQLFRILRQRSSVLPATGLFSLLPLKAKSFKIMVHADRLQSLSTILAEATSVRVSPVLLLRPLFSAHSTGGSI